MEHREVVIVGGGPAGSVAALLLARAGHDVLLLERATLPRNKPCGDCLSAGSTRVLERLGLLPAVEALAPARLQGWRIASPDGSSFIGRFDDIVDGSPSTALAVARDRLDAVLLDAAVAAGAELRTGARVTSAAYEGTGCSLGLHGGGQRLHARLLIGADGLRSIVARSLGAVLRAPRLRKLSLSIHASPPHSTMGLGEMHLARGACMGIAPVTASHDVCNITLVVKRGAHGPDIRRPGHTAAQHTRDGTSDPRRARLGLFVEGWRQRFPLLRAAGPIEPIGGATWMGSGPFDVPVRTVVFDGAALVGDAAGYYDPFTGQGIHQALVGAERLAEIATEALRAPGALRREHLAPWADAHASITRGARRVQRLVDAVLERPATANAAIRALARSAPARNALLGVTGDLRSARSLLHPRLTTATLHSLLRGIVTLLDEHRIDAPPDVCFQVAADVERWPDILPHYRRVRFQQRRDFGTGRVEMAAWRDFGGPFRYPTWWVSEMRVDHDEPAVHYDHVDGITRGMIVKWMFEPQADGATLVRITHAWDGPAWPLIGPLAWRFVISRHFVSAIAQRTLAGVAAEATRIREGAHHD